MRPDLGFDVRLVLYNDQMQVLGSNYQNGYPDLDPVKTYSNGSSTFFVHVFDAVNSDKRVSTLQPDH